MIYEIGNADRPYTAEAPDNDIAIVGTKLLGIHMTLKPEGGEEIDVDTAKTTVKASGILGQRMQEVIDFFDSVVPGTIAQRKVNADSTWALEGFMALARQRADILRRKMESEKANGIDG